MGIKDLLFKKKTKEETAEAQEAETGTSVTAENAATAAEAVRQKAVTAGEFVMGVQDRFALVDSKDVVVVGRVKGTVRVGDAVYVSNIGDDEGSVLLTQVLGMEIDRGVAASEATDRHVAIRLEAAASQPIKCGTVLYTRDISTKDVHDAYISALGDVYVAGKHLQLSAEELDKLSIADCSEIWRLYAWYAAKVEGKNGDDTEVRRRIEAVAGVMCRKILAAESICCVYSKVTGEPYLFSKTVDRQDGTYMCTPPDILIIPKAYKGVMEKVFSNEQFELREISNTESGKEIYNFLGSTFYLNGACGVQVIGNQTCVAAEKLVERPDYSQVPEINRPVTNPDVERWLLLMAQLGKPQGESGELVYRLYFNFMAREIVKARFLVPMKKDGEIPAPDAEGKTVLKEGVTLKFPTFQGKDGRTAIRMYTDWKRLYMGMGEGWEGFIQPIEAMIGQFDCAINLTQYEKAGCYVGEEMFRDMKERAEKEQAAKERTEKE